MFLSRNHHQTKGEVSRTKEKLDMAQRKTPTLTAEGIKKSQK